METEPFRDEFSHDLHLVQEVPPIAMFDDRRSAVCAGQLNGT